MSCDIVRQFYAFLLQLRGHSHKLFVPFCSSSIRKNYFVFRMLRIWNELPTVVVCSNVFIVFKRRLTNLTNPNIYVELIDAVELS